MTALLTPPDATAATPEPSEGKPVQLIRVHANLLPDEIIAARRLVSLKRRLGAGIAALVALLAVAYGYSWWQTNNAQGDLTAEQGRALAMTSQLQKYAPLVAAQAKTTEIQTQLATAMSGDLQWSQLISALNRSTGGKLTVTSVNGSVAAGAAAGDTAAGAAPDPLNSSGLQIVGSLTIGGITPDYGSVAAFVDTLSKVKGIALVTPGSVGGNRGDLTFSVTMSLTTDALGGRFTPTAPATGATTPGGK